MPTTPPETMTPAYALTIDLPRPLPDAIDVLQAALAAERLAIVSQVDVQAALKAGLGLDSHPQKPLRICSPTASHALLGAEPGIGAQLPFGGGVSEATPGVAHIAQQDPTVIAATLRRVVARLANGTA